MKKLILIVSTCVFLSSCVKTWDCVCRQTTDNPNGGVPIIERNYYPFFDNKAGARKSCDAMDKEKFMGSETDCHLTE